MSKKSEILKLTDKAYKIYTIAYKFFLGANTSYFFSNLKQGNMLGLDSFKKYFWEYFLYLSTYEKGENNSVLGINSFYGALIGKKLKEADMGYLYQQSTKSLHKYYIEAGSVPYFFKMACVLDGVLLGFNLVDRSNFSEHMVKIYNKIGELYCEETNIEIYRHIGFVDRLKDVGKDILEESKQSARNLFLDNGYSFSAMYIQHVDAFINTLSSEIPENCNKYANMPEFFPLGRKMKKNMLSYEFEDACTYCVDYVNYCFTRKPYSAPFYGFKIENRENNCNLFKKMNCVLSKFKILDDKNGISNLCQSAYTSFCKIFLAASLIYKDESPTSQLIFMMLENPILNNEFKKMELRYGVQFPVVDLSIYNNVNGKNACDFNFFELNIIHNKKLLSLIKNDLKLLLLNLTEISDRIENDLSGLFYDYLSYFMKEPCIKLYTQRVNFERIFDIPESLKYAAILDKENNSKNMLVVYGIFMRLFELYINVNTFLYNGAENEYNSIYKYANAFSNKVGEFVLSHCHESNFIIKKFDDNSVNSEESKKISYIKKQLKSFYSKNNTSNTISTLSYTVEGCRDLHILDGITKIIDYNNVEDLIEATLNSYIVLKFVSISRKYHVEFKEKEYLASTLKCYFGNSDFLKMSIENRLKEQRLNDAKNRRKGKSLLMVLTEISNGTYVNEEEILKDINEKDRVKKMSDNLEHVLINLCINKDMHDLQKGNGTYLSAYLYFSIKGAIQFFLKEYAKIWPGEADKLANDSLSNMSWFLSKKFGKNFLESANNDKVFGIRDENGLQKSLQSLNSLVGLTNVKSKINQIVENIQSIQQAKEKGIIVKSGNSSISMVFSGNPGTGKTKVGQLVSEIFYQLGVLEQNKVIRVVRSDLVGQHIGDTEVKTKKKLEEAKGGILFVDEVYQLVTGSKNDFGKIALETIMDAMEQSPQKYTVIIAGYDKDIDMVMDANPGLKSRFKDFIHFDDYDNDECFEIFKFMFNDEYPDCIISDSLKFVFNEIIDNYRKTSAGMFGNARNVRTVFEKVKASYLNRIVKDDSNANELKECDFKFLVPQKKREVSIAIRDEKQLENVLNQLNSLVGLSTVKTAINKKYKLARAVKEAEVRGLATGIGKISLSMVFTGNPGTGKTTVGQLVADIFYQLGYLKTNTVTRMLKNSVISKYKGEAVENAKKILEKAKGGVLFIDEVYQFNDKNGDNTGQEIIDVIMDAMEQNPDDYMVIIAGYTNDVEEFLETNPGLKSRFGDYIHFDDYNNTECFEIFKKIAYSMNPDVLIKDDVRDALYEAIDEARTKEGKSFGNARTVTNIYNNVAGNALSRRMESGFTINTLEAVDFKKEDNV